MRGVFFALCAIAVLGKSNTAAAYETGNELLLICKSSHSYERGHCDGYIRGAIAGFDAGNVHGSDGVTSMKPPIFCISRQVTILQLRDIFIRYLEQNPGHRNLPAEPLLFSALTIAFPCGSIR